MNRWMALLALLALALAAAEVSIWKYGLGKWAGHELPLGPTATFAIPHEWTLMVLIAYVLLWLLFVVLGGYFFGRADISDAAFWVGLFGTIINGVLIWVFAAAGVENLLMVTKMSYLLNLFDLRDMQDPKYIDSLVMATVAIVTALCLWQLRQGWKHKGMEGEVESSHHATH